MKNAVCSLTSVWLFWPSWQAMGKTGSAIVTVQMRANALASMLCLAEAGPAW